jgi:hypothetical protein
VFAPGTTLGPGASTLVVRNRSAFLTDFSAVLESQIAGEFPAGTALDNGGETLKLDDVDGSTIDIIRWDDTAPWPTSPDGSGTSLHFIVGSALVPDGGDAARWFAWTPDPGTVPKDGDGDGNPDLSEFRAGTDPADATDFFRMTIVAGGGGVTGSYHGVAGKTYRVQWSANLTDWTALGPDLTPVADGVQTFTDAQPPTSRRFYRMAFP